MSIYQNGLFLLDSSIDKMKSNLERYAKLPNANENYINVQNKLIADLCDSFNTFNSLTLYDTWCLLDSYIKAKEMQDPQLSGHNIILRTRPEGIHFSLVNINPFE